MENGLIDNIMYKMLMIMSILGILALLVSAFLLIGILIHVINGGGWCG